MVSVVLEEKIYNLNQRQNHSKRQQSCFTRCTDPNEYDTNRTEASRANGVSRLASYMKLFALVEQIRREHSNVDVTQHEGISYGGGIISVIREITLGTLFFF
ncbi:hypothetical protein PAMP_014604 [Pampus punctatissimus]